MTLPLPYSLGDDEEPVQANFKAIAQQFPLSRKSMAVESPHEVGTAGEPAFQGTWANFGSTWRGARFWKDPVGVVHLEGLVAGGATATTVFTLPAGYRPGMGVLFGSDMNAQVHARIDVESDGDVIARFGAGGTNIYVSLSGISFRQEQ